MLALLLPNRRRRRCASPESDITPMKPKRKNARNSTPADDGLKHEGALHANIRLAAQSAFERVHDEDEDGAEELPAGPADGAAYLWTDGLCCFDQVFERAG